MTAISRKQRFIALLIICCVSFFVFGWYMRTEEEENFKETQLAEFVNPSENLANVNSKDNHEKPSVQTFGSGGESTKLNVSHVKKPYNKFIIYENDEHSNEIKGDKQKGNLKTLSGPSEFAKEVTVPSLRYVTDLEHSSHTELEPSGPTTLEPSGPTVLEPSGPTELPPSGPTKLEPSGPTELPPSGPTELEPSGPTKYKQMKVTSSYMRPPSTVLESSGPTNFNYIESTTLIPEKEEFYINNYELVTIPVKKPGLILDTPACKIPKLNPFDPTVIQLYEKQDPYKCPGPPLFMKSQPDGSIIVSKKILEKHYHTKPEELACTYRAIHRKHEDKGNVRENDYTIGSKTVLKFGVPLNEDYVAVECKLKSGKNFEQYFPLVRLKESIEKKRSAISPPEPRLNVILAGIDSISKLNFLRHFPRTHAFLKEKMQPFEMKGYTKVGDNTFPNLVPLLTGHFVEYYWNETVRDTMYFDDLDLIWKDYAKKGFRTFYAEDSPYTGTFNYLKRGFYEPPTDYYFRPLALALEKSKVKKKSKAHCYNSQIEPDLIYDYLRDFLQAMSDTRPYIAFAMVSTITHDYLNNAGWEDEPTVHLLESLWSSGALNNSALVLFGDHGLRFGPIRQTYIGKFEERMPFMYVHFPEWFLDKYPNLAKNLHDNQNRLMTLFDVHATMIHLLDLERKMTPEEKVLVTQGTSLLQPISPNRTCEDANILPHWCPCQTFETVPLDGTAAQKSAQAIVDDINTKLKPYDGSCAILEIANISDARLGKANDLVLSFLRHDNVVVDRKVVLGEKVKPIGDYLITLTTKPGGAVFEGTVRHDPKKDSYTVLGISRINLYGNQSWCIDSQKMKVFCYCLSSTPS